jgi:membrane protein
MRARDLPGLLQEAFASWNRDSAVTLGGALAYFALFSIAPILFIAISVAGLVFGRPAVTGQVYAQVQGLVGSGAAQTIQVMIQNAYRPQQDVLSVLVGLAALVIGSAGVFAELKYALNVIWDVRPPASGNLVGLVRAEFISFGMVVGVGFLLLVSLAISAALAAFGGVLNANFPALVPILRVINLVFSFGVVTLIFAMIFKVLPDARIPWQDVWIGAAVTALLFDLGKLVIGLYVGVSNLASGYGAAGSLVVVLVWVYYASLILFFGAEITKVFARRYGHRPVVAEPGKRRAPGQVELAVPDDGPRAS